MLFNTKLIQGADFPCKTLLSQNNVAPLSSNQVNNPSFTHIKGLTNAPRSDNKRTNCNIGQTYIRTDGHFALEKASSRLFYYFYLSKGYSSRYNFYPKNSTREEDKFSWFLGTECPKVFARTALLFSWSIGWSVSLLVGPLVGWMVRLS